jgi:hypothetical protein
MGRNWTTKGAMMYKKEAEICKELSDMFKRIQRKSNVSLRTLFGDFCHVMMTILHNALYLA